MSIALLYLFGYGRIPLVKLLIGCAETCTACHGATPSSACWHNLHILTSSELQDSSQEVVGTQPVMLTFYLQYDFFR